MINNVSTSLCFFRNIRSGRNRKEQTAASAEVQRSKHKRRREFQGGEGT